MLKTIAKAIFWLGTKIVTTEPRIYKRSGQYVIVEDLKLFGYVVETTERKVKDLVSEEAK
mgnify:CR=1 FL=1